ncbi:MAG: 3'-5' exonuclease [Opitutales bacterium]
MSLGRKNAPGGAIAFQPAACGGAPGKATLRLSEAELPRLWHREISALSGAPAEAADASVANVSHDILALLRASRDGHLGLGMGEGTPSRALEPGDIAVLVNFNREADAIQESLRGLGVTSVRLKSASVFASDEARQYLLALRAMLDPSEALVNPLLIGPLFEYSERQLRELPTGRRQEIVDTLRRLGQRWREGFGGNNVAWQGLLEAFEVRALLLSRPEGERRLTNFLQLAEIAGSLERTEALGPDGLIRRLGILIEEGGCDADEANQMRLESDARAVKILTMHSAKGLEFPVVFLPTLWCREARASSELRPLPEKHDPDTLAGWEADDEKFERDRAETLRLGYVALTRSINLCVYYHAQDLEMPKKNNAKFGKGWFDAWMAAERSTPLEVSDFHDNLNRLAARPRLLLAAPCEPPSPQPRTLPLPSDKGLTITSFSALSRHSSADGVHLQEPASRGGEEEHEGRRGPENPGRADLLLPSFPGGTRSGTCLHACFEEVDFNVPLRWPEAAASAIARHFPERPEPWRRVMATEILEVLEQLTAKPFSVPTGKPVVLADLSSNKLAREMDFYFPVHGAEAARLWEVVGAWCKRQGLAFSEPNLSPSEVEGFLTGSIDLFFAQGEQYYVLDWKTNRPLEGQPETRASYDTDGMHEQMLHGQYYLQALIYSVAATAFLRERLGETFSFERHFGGFVYVFVRGLGPKTGRFTGLFNQAEIDAARAILGTGLLPERSVS